jgi:hypothetical protein
MAIWAIGSSDVEKPVAGIKAATDGDSLLRLLRS